jgi:DNA-binding CsgD family transcriptional regulator
VAEPTEPSSPAATRRRIRLLATVVALQAVAAAFFAADALADVRVQGWGAHEFAETVAVLALAAGVLLGAIELRRMLARAARADAALAVARGALAELVQQRFEGWRLTPAEAQVAMYALKGFDGPEIARLRSSAPGTVRAQLAQVYAKAGVASRPELLSLFLDDLFDGLEHVPMLLEQQTRKPMRKNRDLERPA